MSSGEARNDVTTPRSSRLATLKRSNWTQALVVGAAIAFVLYGTIAAKLDTLIAQQQTRDLAEPLTKLCTSSPEARRTVGSERCEQAAEIKDAPDPLPIDGKNGTDGKNGNDGKDGVDGRGIANTAVIEGHLFVTYTDGIREDKGVVAVDGRDGRGITGARIDDGQLLLTYTDGTSEVVGRIVGRDGNDGRGVRDVSISESYHIIVTYTDNTVEDIGALPPGPSGPPGRGIVTLDIDLETCVVTIYYTDNTSETKPASGCVPATGEESPSPSPSPTDDTPLPPTG